MGLVNDMIPVSWCPLLVPKLQGCGLWRWSEARHAHLGLPGRGEERGGRRLRCSWMATTGGVELEPCRISPAARRRTPGRRGRSSPRATMVPGGGARRQRHVPGEQRGVAGPGRRLKRPADEGAGRRRLCLGCRGATARERGASGSLLAEDASRRTCTTNQLDPGWLGGENKVGGGWIKGRIGGALLVGGNRSGMIPRRLGGERRRWVDGTGEIVPDF